MISQWDIDQVKHNDVLVFRNGELRDNGWITDYCGFQDRFPKLEREALANTLGDNTEEYRQQSLFPDLEITNPQTHKIDHYEEIKGWKILGTNMFPEAEQILYNIERRRPVWYFTYYYPTYSDGSINDRDRTFLYCSAWDLLAFTGKLLESPGTKTPTSAIQRFKELWEKIPANNGKELIHDKPDSRPFGTSADVKAVITGANIRKIIERNNIDRNRKPNKLVEEYLLE
jgi:hypothetical protein